MKRILFYLLALALASVAQAQPRYTITDLGEGWVPFDMNKRGNATGFQSNLTIYSHAVVWRYGVFSDISAGGTYWTGETINEFDEVLLNALNDRIPGAIWRNGTIQIIPFPATISSWFLVEMNNSGAILGFNAGTTGTFILQNGAMQNMKYPGAFVESLNNRNQMTGEMANSQGVVHAVFWNNINARPVDLGALGPRPALNQSQTRQINDHGQIVGYSNLGPTPAYHSGEPVPASLAFIYENGIMKSLGTLPGYNSSYALSVNNSGEVIGSCSINGVGNVAWFIWTGGKMYDFI